MQIDEEKILDDLLMLRQKIMRNPTDRKFIKYYPIFTTLNCLLYDLTGCYISEKDLILGTEDEFVNKIEQYKIANAINFIDKVIDEANNIFILFSSYKNVIKESNFIKIYNCKHRKRFSEEETIEIILDFFSRYGENIYKIAAEYLTGKLIELDAPVEEGYAGFYIPNDLSLKGYITLMYENIDLKTISSLCHEIGHAIDYEMFIYPQQKELGDDNQLLCEVPSTFFEIQFLEYAEEKHLDDNFLYTLYTSNINMLNKYIENFMKFYNTDTGDITLDEQFITPDEELIPLDKVIHYGLGYSFAYNLSELYHENPDEFMTNFMNMLCNRKEQTLEKSIESLGIDMDDFLGLTKTKDTLRLRIKNNNKRFNINE